MLVVDTKEEGQKRLAPAEQLGTQRYFMRELTQGLDEDIHRFVVLKGRQQGMTTICSALDLFWHYEYPGMQGTFAAHNEEARDNFRSMLTMYHDGLPKQYRIAAVQNNRYFISFKNRSRIAMQIGGGPKSKKSGGKGRGQAFTFLHATEVSSWEDEEALGSMVASLAQRNPRRLQVFESTARGFNMFHDIWKDAKRAVTQRAIFVGWWRNQFYRKEVDSNEYRAYWDGKLTPSEREWVRVIRKLYDFEVSAEQMAWWRWMIAEEIHDESLMMQEHPPHEHLAFILSGKNFFGQTDVQATKKQVGLDPLPEYYKIRIGDDFMDTTCEESIDIYAELRVWEQPDDNGFYSIGADPAYGSSENADRFCVSVWRCYADRFEQVAEYCTPDLPAAYQFAWIICYLAGAYKQSMVNLEMNGPGQAVLSEIRNLRRKASSLPRNEAKALTDVVGHMQYYLFKRLDAPGGSNTLYMYKTTGETKERMCNTFRDLWYRRLARVASIGLVGEMESFVREDSGELKGSGTSKDDRVIAASLAAVQYNDHQLPTLQQHKITWQQEFARRSQLKEQGHAPTAEQSAMQRNLRNFLQSAGIKTP